MKKKFLNLLESLSRDEMRNISGGYGDNCYNCCESAYQVCQTGCRLPDCNTYDCIINQWLECQRVLGCSCA
jgi:hypothetical protein